MLVVVAKRNMALTSNRPLMIHAIPLGLMAGLGFIERDPTDGKDGYVNASQHAGDYQQPAP